MYTREFLLVYFSIKPLRPKRFIHKLRIAPLSFQANLKSEREKLNTTLKMSKIKIKALFKKLNFAAFFS